MKQEKKKVGILLFGSPTKELSKQKKANRFSEEIKKQGFKPEFFFCDLFSIYFEQNKLEIFYNNEKLDLEKIAFFVARYTLSDYNKMSIANFLEESGVVVYNSFSATFLAKNKRDSLLELSQAGLPIIPTGINFSQYFLDQHLKANLDNPIVVKRNNGSLGTNVAILDSHMSFISFMEFSASKFVPSEILIQPFIDANAEDYRIIVVGNKVVASMKRKANGIEFRANISKGGSGSKIKITKKIADMAIKATKILGLDYAGVDIIKNKQGKLMLVEVNANPGLEIEKITNINVAGEIVKYCIKKSR